MGHATRSIAVIRELQKSNVAVTVRNNHLVDFLESSLLGIDIIPGMTDVGPTILDDGVSIDTNKTRISVGGWIDDLKRKSNEEYDSISKYSPDLIVSDISAMPFWVSKKLQIPSVAISNFSWYDVLDCISLSQLEILKESYDNAELAIQLPLSTKMDHFRAKKRVGFVCRSTTTTRDKIRKKIGLKDSEFLVFFALGKSSKKISCKKSQDVKIMSSGIEIKNHDIISAPKTIEGQDLVSASDLVICKLGYGITSECITCGTPFLYLYDSNHREQKAMSEGLYNRGYRNNISFDEINDLNLTGEYIEARKTMQKEKIETNIAVKYMLEMLVR